MVNRIKNIIRKNKVLLENFSYLGVLQLITLGTPFLVLPFLIRTLGADKYGAVILAQTIVSFIVIIINFGFDLYGSKEIALHKSDKKMISEIVFSILLIKIGLSIILFAIYFIIILLINIPYIYKLLYAFSSTLALLEILVPRWFFQGVEKMKNITLIVGVSRILYLVLIFSIIKDESDFFIVPLLNGFSGLLAGIFGLIIMFKSFNISFIVPHVNQIKNVIKEAIPYFIAKTSSKLRDSSNVIIIGLLFSNTFIAYYDVAYKIISVFTVVFQNIPIVILPKISLTKDARFARRIFWFSIIGAILFFVIIQFSAKFLLSLFGGIELEPASIYLRILAVFSIIYAANTLISYYLIANNLQKEVYKSIFISLIIYLSLLMFLVVIKSLIVLIAIFLFATLTDFLYKYRILRKNNLISWIYEPKAKI